MSEANRSKPMRIKWDKSQCTGCVSCVIVCSERHTGMSAPSRSRIEILVDPLGGDLAAKYCRQCKNALCAEACPEDAIQYDETIRAWLVDDGLCTGCGLCVEACPFEAIRLDVSTDTAIKCDLCMGATWCVEVCPAKALTVQGHEQKRQNGE
ncbi:MAG: 4Fe-4S dicluster domain-containing protein [Chloroflexota bacterium]